MSEAKSNSVNQITENDNILMLGSCFSDNVSSLLKKDKLDVVSNVFGVLFHPVAIFKLLKRACLNQEYTPEDFFESDNYWFNYEFHGSNAKTTREEAVEFANENLKKLKTSVLNADFLFLTFGSARAYYKQETIVANCHKQSSSLFGDKLSSIQDLAADYSEVQSLLSEKNPELQIVLTVSPVQYIREGLVGNRRSKSLLNVFCHEMVEKFVCTSYFPSYELVVDELRDYTFYKRDKAHPNVKAQLFVYARFKEFFFSEVLKKRTADLNQIQTQLEHKSLFPHSSSNLKFKEKVMSELIRFENQYKVVMSNEKSVVELTLKAFKLR